MKYQIIFRKTIFAALLLFSFAVIGQTISAQNNKAALIQRVGESSDPLRAELLDKFVTLNLSAGCWEKFSNEDSYPNPIRHLGAVGKAIQGHSKLMGYGDLEDAVSGVVIDRGKANAAIKQLTGKFSYTINAQNIDCADEQFRLLAAYSLEISEFFGDSSSSIYGLNRGWRPRAGKMFIVLELSPTARDISVKISPDGATFTVTAPVNIEPGEWDTKIEQGLAKGGK